MIQSFQELDMPYRHYPHKQWWMIHSSTMMMNHILHFLLHVYNEKKMKKKE